VLYTGNRELYAWPGSRKFDELDPRIASTGLSSTGEFASHAHTVFASNTAQIHFSGSEAWHGRDAVKYNFRVPAMESGWVLNIGGAVGVVGERGAFWADPKTLEVLRLEVFADEIPPALPVESAEVGIEYGRVRIGDVDILAPQQAEVLITHLDRGQSRNLVEFSQCRQYHAESAISFDTDTAVPAPTDAAALQDVELPADLPLKLQLDAAFDSDSAAQGDMITAHLMAPAERQGHVYIPQGALVRGRIRRLDRYPLDKPYIVVGIEFSEIEFGNKRAAFLGHLDQMDSIRGQLPTATASVRSATPYIAPMQPGNSSGGQVRYGVTPGAPSSGTQTVRIVNLTELELPGVGTFAVEGKRVQLPAGFRMTWRTVSLAPAQVAPARKK
jgi:hypothetical protein